MMNNVALRVAVSAIAIGTTMVACKPAADSYRPNSVSARAPQSTQQATTYFAKANAAVQKGDLAEALEFAEKAVERSPRDIAYRMLLADLYLKNGRFRSAETTFADVLTLEPGNPRASLSIALARIALGRTGEAIAQLDELAQTAAPGDVGLAYALAGDARRAIEMLEPAARAPDANGRIRQNLALAYAIAGDWQKARIIAAQDVAPAELGKRMQQWATLARPSAPWSQVAALLGVTPVVDAGQPVRLALSQPEPATTAYAAAEPIQTPAPVPVEAAAALPAPQAAPIQFAQGGPEEPAPVAVEPAPAPVAVVVEKAPEPVTAEAALKDVAEWVSAASDPAPAANAPAPSEETKPVYAEVVQALVTPQAAVIEPRPIIKPPAARFERAPVRAPAPKPRVAANGTGRYVVQLGAYSTAGAVERAWSTAYKRYGFASQTPLSTTIRIGGKTLHRLSVAGFASRGDATRVCQSVKAKGGACFVRAVAGDAPTQWAGRYTGRRA